MSHSFSCEKKVIVCNSRSTLQKTQGQVEVPGRGEDGDFPTNICHLKGAQEVVGGDRAIRCVRWEIRISAADQLAKANTYVEKILFNVLCSFICG